MQTISFFKKVLTSFIWIYSFGIMTDVLAQSFLPIYQKGMALFESDLMIGGDVSEEDYIFSEPSDICVDSQGNIFIVDIKEHNVKKYDSNGKHVKTFGKKGQGPGEFLDAYQIELDSKKNVVVYDLTNKRFNWFTNECEFINSIPFDEILYKFKIGLNDNIYIETWKIDYANVNQGETHVISCLSPDLKSKTAIDSVKTKVWEYVLQPKMMQLIVPFFSNLYWGIAPSGNLITAYSEDYTINIFSPELKLIKRFQYEGKKVKVTNKDKENWGSKEKSDLEDLKRKLRKFPKFKPYFQDIHIDHDGYLLLKTYETKGDNFVYHVFDKEGTFVGNVSLPSINSTAVFNKGYIYDLGTTNDEFPFLKRYSLK
jgi:hypothetical protein